MAEGKDLESSTTTNPLGGAETGQLAPKLEDWAAGPPDATAEATASAGSKQIFGPEKAIVDPVVAAYFRGVYISVMRVGAVSFVLFAVLVLAVPGRRK